MTTEKKKEKKVRIGKEYQVIIKADVMTYDAEDIYFPPFDLIYFLRQHLGRLSVLNDESVRVEVRTKTK